CSPRRPRVGRSSCRRRTSRRNERREPGSGRRRPRGNAPGIRPPPAKAEGVRRRELDSRLLILVTLALVAFGLVMVYSATSASATVGGSDPVYYLKRQVIYATLGIAAMILLQRWDYRRLRLLSPVLVLASLVLLAAVL